MRNATNYTITIPANSVYRQLVQGNYFKIVNATGPVTVKTERARLDSLITGQGMEKTPFDWIEFVDTSGANNKIKFVVAEEGFLDGTNGSVSISSNAPVTSAAYTNTNPTVTNASAQLVAANATRRYLLIQNNDTAGSIFIVFGVAATTALGVKIAPGGSYEMDSAQSTQAIFAIGSIPSNTNIVVVQG